MKIIKNAANNVVLFAGNDLVLTENGCGGDGWQFRNIDPNNLTLETVVSIPAQFVGGGWSYAEGVWTSNEIADQVILPVKRAEKIAQLEAQSSAANTANIDYLGHSWRADLAGQALLAQVLSLDAVPSDMYWRDSSGVSYTMTLQELKGLGLAILIRGLGIDTNLKAKTAAVKAATTAAEIDSIAW